MGPGSVSSFLKVILDVVFAALWTSLAILSVVIACNCGAVMASLRCSPEEEFELMLGWSRGRC